MELGSNDLEKKERALYDLLQSYGSALIGYSGGVDSAYLAHAALAALGPDKVLAVTGRSPSYPEIQQRVALQVAESIGLPRIEIETGELDDPDYVANRIHRCYFCKADLYGRLVGLARERGYAVVLDGSNADDLDDYRPGSVAAGELGVHVPLQEVGLTKSEIRTLSRRAGLPTWEMPAAPCLASRIRYGLPVTPARLRQIEEAESGLREIADWRDFRVRHHGGLARLEVDVEGLAGLSDPGLRALAKGVLLAAGFPRACIDLGGYRRGALNERPTPAAGGAPSGDGATVDDLERRLRDNGVAARVEAAGVEGEVAILIPADESAANRLVAQPGAVVEGCRAAGFRFVGLGLY